MRKALIASASLVLSFTSAIAQNMPGHNMPGMNMGPASDGSGAQIIVTVNPEARVSADLTSPQPAIAVCGAPLHLSVKVLNQAGITAPLRARLVDPPAGVAMTSEGAPLSGRPEDWLMLQLVSRRREATDLTIAFSFTGDVGDLADRDRVHLLLRC
jgi:hypothetical protein